MNAYPNTMEETADKLAHIRARALVLITKQGAQEYLANVFTDVSGAGGEIIVNITAIQGVPEISVVTMGHAGVQGIGMDDTACIHARHAKLDATSVENVYTDVT